MIKKQILCCSALFSLLSLAKVSDFETTFRKQGSESSASQHLLFYSDAYIEEIERAEYLNSLHFANVFVPISDKQIEKKMKTHLRAFTYRKQGTYRIHELASSTLPRVERILREYGIPEDFKYMPLVESGLTKDAISPKGAFGYWQFMPATARAFGLTVSDEVDERQDLIKSTHAAARYLQALHREFEDWALVAAAYNVGSGNLRKAMDVQDQRDYFQLKLNRETEAYVYQLIAMKEIIEHPDRYGYAKSDNRLLAQVVSADQLPQNRGILRD